MKRFYLLVVAVLGFAATASAQTFDVGTQNITATLGFGSGNTIPLAISYEQGIYDFGGDHKLGLGGYIGFVNSMIYPAVECNYHFVGVNKLDLYGGVRLGYGLSTETNYGDFFNSFDIGANYYLNSSWAINAEVGSGLGNLNLGVTHRF
ncbi:MAG: hypothetical protein SNH73_06445 [Rikenellaceae bacterium]